MHLLWLLLLIPGLFFVLEGILGWRSARRTWDWPVATARVTDIHPIKHDSEFLYDDPRYSHSYDFRFFFRYDVGGRAFHNSGQAKFSGNGPGADAPGPKEKARRLASQHQVGSTFDVRYNSDNPMEVLLLPQSVGTGRASLALALTMIVEGVLLGIVEVVWWVAAIVGVVGALLAWVVAETARYPFSDRDDPRRQVTIETHPGIE